MAVVYGCEYGAGHVNERAKRMLFSALRDFAISPVEPSPTNVTVTLHPHDAERLAEILASDGLAPLR